MEEWKANLVLQMKARCTTLAGTSGTSGKRLAFKNLLETKSWNTCFNSALRYLGVWEKDVIDQKNIREWKEASG